MSTQHADAVRGDEVPCDDVAAVPPARRLAPVETVPPPSAPDLPVPRTSPERADDTAWTGPSGVTVEPEPQPRFEAVPGPLPGPSDDAWTMTLATTPAPAGHAGRHTDGVPAAELVRRHTGPVPTVDTGRTPTPGRTARRRVNTFRIVRSKAFGATTASVLVAGAAASVVGAVAAPPPDTPVGPVDGAPVRLPDLGALPVAPPPGDPTPIAFRTSAQELGLVGDPATGSSTGQGAAGLAGAARPAAGAGATGPVAGVGAPGGPSGSGGGIGPGGGAPPTGTAPGDGGLGGSDGGGGGGGMPILGPIIDPMTPGGSGGGSGGSNGGNGGGLPIVGPVLGTASGALAPTVRAVTGTVDGVGRAVENTGLAVTDVLPAPVGKPLEPVVTAPRKLVDMTVTRTSQAAGQVTGSLGDTVGGLTSGLTSSTSSSSSSSSGTGTASAKKHSTARSKQFDWFDSSSGSSAQGSSSTGSSAKDASSTDSGSSESDSSSSSGGGSVSGALSGVTGALGG